MRINVISVERLIHSLKTAFACVIGVLIGKLLGFASAQWIVVSTVLIMCAQISVGSVMQRSYLRLLGTVIGCVYSVLALLLIHKNSHTLLISVTIASFLFSYLAIMKESLNYVGTLAALTTVIILLSPEPTYTTAGYRFLDISVGILIAALVSQFVLPIHARSQIRKQQATILKELRDYYVSCIVQQEMTPITKAHKHELEENLAASLNKLRLLAKEAARERFGAFFDPKEFKRILLYEKKMVRSIDFMHNALNQLKSMESNIPHLPSLKSFHAALVRTFNALINCLKSNYDVDSIEIPSLKSLKKVMEAHIQIAGEQETFYINGFLFSAETLARCLANIAKLQGLSITYIAVKSE